MSTQTAASQSPRMISLGFDPEPWPAGTHMCMIFNDDEERRGVIARFLESGLEGDELVRYLVDTQTPEELKKSIRDEGVNLPDKLDGKQYVILNADATYCPDGTFKADRMLDVIAGRYHQSIREGYIGARATAEMSWSTRGHPGSENLVEYEARGNIMVRTAPTTLVCQYDARVFDGATLYGILCVHPAMIVHGQVLRNPYYVEPEAFLAKRAARIS
jgi:hypothetical protein